MYAWANGKEYSWSTGGYSSNWTISALKDMLNGAYYESKSGECWKGSIGNNPQKSECDFSGNGGLPKGLDETARNMIDKEIIWNLGGSSTYKDVTVKMFYERERGTSSYSNYPVEWSSTTDVGNKHNGIALMYPSDYGYAVGGEVRNNCLTKNLFEYGGDNCATNDWIFKKDYIYFLTTSSSEKDSSFALQYNGPIYTYPTNLPLYIEPTLYLTTSTKIVDGTGEIGSPYVLK